MRQEELVGSPQPLPDTSLIIKGDIIRAILFAKVGDPASSNKQLIRTIAPKVSSCQLRNTIS